MIAKSFDAEAGTFEAVVATETPVRRWFGNEILRCSRSAIDTVRLADAPLLDSHRTGSFGDTVGQVTGFRIEGSTLLCTFRLADSELGRRASQLLAEGMLKSVSVGYQVLEYDRERRQDGETDVTVTRWQPYEVSLVSVPADPNAKIRSMEPFKMDDDEIETVENDNPNRSLSNAVTRRIERQIENIRTQAIDAGLAEADVDVMLEGARNVDQARAAVFDALAERSSRARTQPGRNVRSGGAEQENQTRALAVDALAVRLGANPTIEGRNQFEGQPVLGIVRGLLESAGVSTRTMDDRHVTELALRGGGNWIQSGSRGMHTTADFPALLDEAGNRALAQRFGAHLTPLKGFSLKRNARDFRPQSFIRPGEAPKLQRLSEAGEIRNGTLNEEKWGLRLEEHAMLFRMSRKAIINDDLGAFSDFIRAFAESAATTEGDLFFELLSENNFGGRKLPDGNNWFHASHGNLGAAGALSVASLSTAREAMQLQKNVNGSGRAGAVPAVILVGPKRQTEAETLVASLTPSQVSQVNPFAGKLRVEVETRYEGVGWWLFADPTTRPALMHGYLDGSEGPQIETKEGWTTPGVEFRCMMDFGCDVYDWRAAYYNPGA